MKFKNAGTHNGDRQETPYVNARREYMERYGDLVKSAHSWKMAAFASSGMSIILGIGLVGLSLQSKVVPYAVELNGHNEVVRVQRADMLSAPNANQIRASMRSWVIGARSVYSDRYAMKNLIDQTYAMTYPDSPAFKALVEYHRGNDPFQRAAHQTVTVDVKIVVPISDTSWQVEWTETTKELSGKIVSVKDMQGHFTVAISPPTDANQIMLNPLGLYVRDFSWTSRLTPE